MVGCSVNITGIKSWDFIPVIFKSQVGKSLDFGGGVFLF